MILHRGGSVLCDGVVEGGEGEDKGGALSWLAEGCERATHHLSELSADTQSKSGASVLFGGC